MVACDHVSFRKGKIFVGYNGQGRFFFLSFPESQPSIFTGSTSTDLMNHELKIFVGKKFQKVPKSKT